MRSTGKTRVGRPTAAHAAPKLTAQPAQRFSPLGVTAALILLLLALCAIVPQWLAPYDPLAINPSAAFEAPSATHWFGTDASGRDVLSRVIAGARESLTIGVIATLTAVLGGLLLGIMSAGSTAHWLAPVRWCANRLIEGLFAFPAILFALLLITVWGPGTWSVVIAVSISTVPGFARIIRGGITQHLHSGTVEAARIQSDSQLRIWSTVVLPEALRPVLVLATLGVGYAVLLAAGLGFLGFGAPPPAPEWGAMLNEGRPYLTKAWWLTFFPGAVIALVGITTTVLGRSVEQQRSPK